MARHEIEGYEIFDRDVRPVENGAHVLVPKRWIGADVKVVRVSEPDADSADEQPIHYNYRYRLKPADELHERLAWTVDTCRQVYNHFLHRLNRVDGTSA